MPLLFGVPGVRRAAGPIGLEAQTVRRSCTAFDLTLSMAEFGDELVGAFEYDTGVFDEAAGSRLAAHFRTLLGQAIANPRRRLAELSLLTPAEKRAQVLDWNATARTYGEPRLLHDLVSAQAARTPDAIALAYEDAAVSYAELQRRASSLATRLRRAGARPETLVALCADRSLELIIGLLGILQSGAAYMPLDPKHPDARLQSLLQQAAPVAAIGHQHHLNRFGDWPGPKLTLDLADEAPLAPIAFPDDCMAYVIHTSGSTGVPKGAINTHQAIGNRLLWGQQAHPVSPRDHVLHKTPLTFDVSVAEIFETLMAGATLVIATPDGHRHPDYLRHVLTREAITIAHFVPTMLRALMDAGGLTGCHALRRIVCTGEALGLDLQTRVFAETPVDFELLNFYGPTEAAVEVTTWQCTRAQQEGSVPIGTPIDNVQTYVLDANLEPCPIGCTGDLYVAGVALARGYLGRPDLTAASFVPSPFGPAPGARLYRTGDLASYQSTGVLRYLGRADAQVKLRGVRVELLEIEAVLAQHEGVGAAAVWVVNGHGGDAILRACVIPRRNDVREGELKAFLKARLPAEMVPAQFAFAERLPLLSNGKVDRAALRGMDFSWEQDTSAGTAPRNPTERHIAAICSQLLERPAADVELNLFELGCHSLLAAKLIARIRDELQVEIPLTAMFGGVATIAALAQAVDALTGKTHSAFVAHD